MINNKGYVIRKSRFSDDQLDSFRKDLNVSPINNYASQEIVSYKIYTETKTHMYLPKYYAIDKLGLTKQFYYAKKINITFTGTLRDDEQKHIVDISYKKYNNQLHD